MDDFFRTRMGQKYYEHDVPMLIKQLSRLADSNEKLIELQMENQNFKIGDLKCEMVIVMPLMEFNEMLSKITNGYISSDVDVENQSGLFFYVTEKSENIISKDIDTMTEQSYIFSLIEKELGDGFKIKGIDIGNTIEQKVYIFYEKC